MKSRKNNLWEDRYKQLREYIFSSEEIAEIIRKYGYINEKKLNIDKDENLIKVINWVDCQRREFMPKYHGKTIAEIEADENIPEKHKNKMIKLLQLGIDYTSKQLGWEENYNFLVEYINSSKEIEKAFIKNGGIKFREKIEKDGRVICIGEWVQHQKQNLMKKYNGMTIEQIENDKNISKQDKERLIKLLKIGVTYPKTREEVMLERKEKAEINKKNKELIKPKNSKEIKKKTKKKKENIKKDDNEEWEKNYKLLIKHINSSEDIKEHFLKTGNINFHAGIENNGKIINIGTWLHTQKQNLMKKYQGKTIEDIENNINISENDKYRMKKLLQLGVSYPMIRNTPYNNEWDKNLEALIEYINSSEKAKKYFEETGRVSVKTKIKKSNRTIYIGRWLYAQKKNILEKYKGISIEQIEEDKNIPEIDKYRLKKLLELGINDSSKKEVASEVQKIFKYDSWKKKYDLLSEYINSSDEIKEHFNKKGTIRIDSIINDNGKIIKIGKWLRDQRSIFMNKYSGMTIEQIQNNPEIHEYDKIKIIKLLELGVSYPIIEETPYNDEWDKNLEVLIEYINSSKEAKKYFEETGRVKEKVIVKKGNKTRYIGRWFYSQKKNILEKYKGISIEQIEEDKNIPEIDKYRLKKLLELGINDTSKEQATSEIQKIFKYNSWKEKYDLLSEYINSSDEIKEHFNKKGTIRIDSIINDNGKIIKIGKWLRDQRSIFMKKYSGMTIEQIQNDPEIHEYDKIKLIKLLELGVAYPKITGQQIGKASFDSKVEECDNADKIIENLKEKRKTQVVNKL